MRYTRILITIMALCVVGYGQNSGTGKAESTGATRLCVTRESAMAVFFALEFDRSTRFENLVKGTEGLKAGTEGACIDVWLRADIHRDLTQGKFGEAERNHLRGALRVATGIVGQKCESIPPFPASNNCWKE